MRIPYQQTFRFFLTTVILASPAMSVAKRSHHNSTQGSTVQCLEPDRANNCTERVKVLYLRVPTSDNATIVSSTGAAPSALS